MPGNEMEKGNKEEKELNHLNEGVIVFTKSNVAIHTGSQ